METTGVKQYKYSILTFVFGEYEKLHEIGEMDSEVEYICVTDNENLKSDTWKIVVDHELDGKGVFDKCFSVRYNPFKYVSSDVVVTVDGSIGLHKPISPLVNKFIESASIKIFNTRPAFITPTYAIIGFIPMSTKRDVVFCIGINAKGIRV
jgi:hypothetical protein